MTTKRALPKTLRFFFNPLRWWMIRFLPTTYLKWQYRYITGKPLNLQTPTTYTEKLQILRHFVFPRDPLVIRGSDRVAVREMLKEKGLKTYLIPTYGVYDRFEDIPWKRLPKQFVLKCSHASGFNRIILDKKNANYYFNYESVKSEKISCIQYLLIKYGLTKEEWIEKNIQSNWLGFDYIDGVLMDIKKNINVGIAEKCNYTYGSSNSPNSSNSSNPVNVMMCLLYPLYFNKPNLKSANKFTNLIK